MKKIDIVSHAWAQIYPHFAGALRYQLSSLYLYPPERVDWRIFICYTPEDEAVMNVLQEFTPLLGDRLWTISLTLPFLGRRCIGRDIATHGRTTADIVWFTDVDYLFRAGTLDSFDEMEWPSQRDGLCSMVYVRHVHIHDDHFTGDVALARAEQPGVIDIMENEFKVVAYKKAIGGIQIARGDIVRNHGYLHDSKKWQQPRLDGNPFGDFRDDLAFRSICKLHGPIAGVELPNVYRLRHSTTTYQAPILPEG
jgi:hypothetical protein